MKRKQIIKRVEYWQTHLGLINWLISIRFEKIVHPKQKKLDRLVGIVKTDANSQYKDARITFRSDKLGLVDEETIIHELIHCLTAEFIGYINGNIGEKTKLWLDYYNEQLCSELARIILRRR